MKKQRTGSLWFPARNPVFDRLRAEKSLQMPVLQVFAAILALF